MVVFDHYRYPDMAHDATWFHLLGVNIAHGRGFADPVAWYFGRGPHPLHLAALQALAKPAGIIAPTAQTPPLFPLALGAVSFVFGDSFYAHQVALCFVGTVTVVLIGLLGRRLGGNRVGLVSAALAALYPMLFQPDVGVMPESLYAPLIVGVLLLAYRMLERPTLGIAAALGAVIGAAALTRSEGLALLPILAVPLVLRLPDASLARRATLLGVVTAAALIGVGAWSVRSSLVFHQLVLSSNDDGSTLAGANCALTYGGSERGSWDYRCLNLSRPRFVGLDEASENTVLLQQGVSYSHGHLASVPLTVAIRLLRTWGFYDPIGQARWERAENRALPVQLLGLVMYMALLPLAVAGLVLLRRRNVWIWPLLSMIALVAIISVTGYGNGRFRIAAEPVILVAASMSVVSLRDRAHRARSG